MTLRKDERWFVHDDRSGGAYESWPVTRADLDPHYAGSEQMLDVQTYPLDHPPYDQTAKTLAMREASVGLGTSGLCPTSRSRSPTPVPRPDPASRSSRTRPNIHGRPRETCRLCGECDLGCNFGSKNTLDYTYLTAAQYEGAEIRTRCEVRDFHRSTTAAGGLLRHLLRGRRGPGRRPGADATHDADRESTDPFGGDVRHDAPAAGQPHVVAGPELEPGQGFSGNGDLLTFAQRVTQEGPDGKRVPRDLEPGRGPVITCAMRVGDALDGDGSTGRGFYLEDAGYPQFVSWMVQALSEPGTVLRETGPLLVRAAEHLLHPHRPENLGDEVSELLGDCLLSAGLLPLLGMGRDVPDGRMTLDGDDLQIDWSRDGGSREFFDRLTTCRARSHTRSAATSWTTRSGSSSG